MNIKTLISVLAAGTLFLTACDKDGSGDGGDTAGTSATTNGEDGGDADGTASADGGDADGGGGTRGVRRSGSPGT